MPTLITPPAGEPVSPAELKAWLRVTFDDEDALLPDLIAAARERVEAALGLSLLTTTWRDSFTAGCAPLRLLRGPVIAVDAVARPDGSAIAGWTLRMTDACAEVVLPLGARGPAVVTWRAGFGDDPAAVPAALRQAVTALAADAYERRADPAAPAAIGLGPAEPWVASFRRTRL